MSKAARKIITGRELQEGIAAGIEATYQVAKAAYGPAAGNAMLEHSYGDPLISRDGVTNVDTVYLEGPVENMAARTVVQASKKNNQKVGDGTTAAIILAYHFYKEAEKLLLSGQNRMEVSRLLAKTAAEAIKQVDDMKLPANDDILKHVAMVSAGDEALGSMIADVVNEVGMDGGVTIEDFSGVGIYNEIVDGFYFRKGFTEVNLTKDPSNLESRHDDIDILISEKQLSTVSDVAPILDKVIEKCGLGRDLIIVGTVSEEVLKVLLLNRLKGNINVTVVDVPTFGAMRSLSLEDLACVTGGKVYTPGASAADFDLGMLGSAKQVIINEYSTTIIGGEGSKEDLNKRITELRKQLSEADSPVTIDALRERLSRLTGKVAVIRVGGATEIEQGEVKLRVQDAVCAVQAAIKDGIVPGGGVALARVISSDFGTVFKKPLFELVDNAGLNTERAFMMLDASKDTWEGFNLKTTGELKLVNLLDQGIVDPALVVKEAVRNAASVVSTLITVAVAPVLADRSQKHD